MPIDPQSISSIGQNSADIGGAVQKAYTLSDAIDRSQMNKMTLASAQEEQADLGKLKAISSKFDLSTAEGQNSYAAEAMKINPTLGMKVQKSMNEAQRGAQELGAAELDKHLKKAEILVNATLPFMQQVQQATQAKVDPQIIETQMLGPAKQVLERLTQEKLPNGEPVLNKTDLQAVQQALSGPPGSLLKFITGAYQSNIKAQQQIAELQNKALQGENYRSEIESRGNKIETVMQNGKPMRVEFDRNGNQLRILGEAPPTAATVQVGGPNAQSLLGELALRGVNIPARTAGAVVAGLKKNYPGISDAQLADMVVTGQATLAGVKAEKRVEGAQVGKIETAIREIPQFAEKALAASAKVPRGEFRPFNKLRLYADTELSNPDLKELKSYLNSLSNAYDVAAARGGTDVNKRAEAHAMLDAADSPETLARAIKVMQDEAAIALKAGQSALRGDQPPPAVSGTTPVPSPATGGTGAAGGTKRWEMKDGKLVPVQ